MSNGNAWHLERVVFKSGWRDIGDSADFFFRWNEEVIPFSVKRVTETSFLGPDSQVPGNESYIEILIALQTNPVKPLISNWFEQRHQLFKALISNVEQKKWNKGTPTSPTTYASLAHLYEILVDENVKDVVSELAVMMNTPTREAAAMRIKTARSREFLTSPSRGVTEGKATMLSQETVPCNWVNTYYR